MTIALLARGLTKPNRSSKRWRAYYRATADRPPRELLNQVLFHIDREGRRRTSPTAIDVGCGAGTDSMELLRRGWRVLAIDREVDAARFLMNRVPNRWRSRVATLVGPMEELNLPPADLVYASFSLPFCAPAQFPKAWASIRDAVRPGGHFAGQLFGDRDEWRRERGMTFHSRPEVRRLVRGWKVELLRETDEDGYSTTGPKQWHYFDLILEKPRTRSKGR